MRCIFGGPRRLHLLDQRAGSTEGITNVLLSVVSGGSGEEVVRDRNILYRFLDIGVDASNNVYEPRSSVPAVIGGKENIPIDQDIVQPAPLVITLCERLEGHTTVDK